jgi:ribosome biogenesis protein SSF1/2
MTDSPLFVSHAYKTINWQEKKRNNLKDFVNVAGPMGVTHFLILSNPQSLPHLRFAKSPQGPTFTFQIEEYSLAADIANSQKRPRCPPGIFKNSPLVYETAVDILYQASFNVDIVN